MQRNKSKACFYPQHFDFLYAKKDGADNRFLPPLGPGNQGTMSKDTGGFMVLT